MNQKDIKTLPILIASDHAGFELKAKLLKEKLFLWKDLGCFNKERTDYPDWADKLCNKIQNSELDSFGLLICGTGQGMAIRANRWKSIRASLCWNEDIAFLARSHNQSNVLCLPAHFLNLSQALSILETFIKTDLNPEPAYKRRIKKLSM